LQKKKILHLVYYSEFLLTKIITIEENEKNGKLCLMIQIIDLIIFQTNY